MSAEPAAGATAGDQLLGAMDRYRERFGDLPQIGPRMTREEFVQRIAAAIASNAPDRRLHAPPPETDNGRTALAD